MLAQIFIAYFWNFLLMEHFQLLLQHHLFGLIHYYVFDSLSFLGFLRVMDHLLNKFCLSRQLRSWNCSRLRLLRSIWFLARHTVHLRLQLGPIHCIFSEYTVLILYDRRRSSRSKCQGSIGFATQRLTVKVHTLQFLYNQTRIRLKYSHLIL